MGRPGCCCCSTPEPDTACSTVTEFIPDHPSTASRRIARIPSGVIDSDVHAKNCTATITIGDSVGGRHPLAITVNPTSDNWTALAVVWFELPTNLDPHVIGSLYRVNGSAAFKPGRAIGWSDQHETSIVDRDGPWVIAGAAVEQDTAEDPDQLFIAASVQHQNLYQPEQCWIGPLGGGGTDTGSEPCRAFHLPLTVDRTSETEYVASGGGPLSSDYFGILQDDGSIDTDQRPDFDLGVEPHPITRFGFVIGLSSCPAEIDSERHGASGTYTLRGTLGPICGVIESHGSPYTDGPPEAPVPPGDLEVDEPCDTLPGGDWTAGYAAPITDYSRAVLKDDSTCQVEGGGTSPAGLCVGGAFTVRDGALFVEQLNSSEDQYAAGSIFIELDHNRYDVQDGWQLTIEFTYRAVRDQDRRYLLPTPEEHELRNQSSGFYLGSIMRFYARNNAAEFYDYQNGFPAAGSRQFGFDSLWPVHPYGGAIDEDRNYTLFPVDYPWAPDVPGNGQEARVRGDLPGNPGDDPRQTGCDLAAPSDGDRFTVVIYGHHEMVRDFRTEEELYVDAWSYSSETWINGRPITGIVTNLETGSHDVGNGGGQYCPPLDTLRFGLLAYRGGGWSDVKLWRKLAEA